MIKYTASYFGGVCTGDTFIHNGEPFIATWEENGGRYVGINLSTGKMVPFLSAEQITPTDFYLKVKATQDQNNT